MCQVPTPFGPFWSVKYLNFRRNLPIQTANHTFLENKHPEVTKNLYYVSFPKESQRKSISSWTTSQFDKDFIKN